MAAYRVGLPVLFRHNWPLTAAPSCCIVPRRHHDPRADRPWFQELQKKKAIEEKKTVTRKIDEMFGLQPGVPPHEREPFDRSVFGKASAKADESNPQWKEKVAYMCVPKTNMQEGISQALWLTKAAPMGEGKIPEHIQQLSEKVEIPNMEENVRKSILRTRLYATEIKAIHTRTFGIRQLESLLRISGVLGTTYPELQQRSLSRHAYVSAMFNRGNDLISTRGDPHGFLLSSKNPLPPLAGPEEINATKDYELPSFYPLAPTIDLVDTHIYKDQDFTGFYPGHAYPHAHTLFVLNIKYQKDHTLLTSRAIMFAHAHAVARARIHYGISEETDLPQPIVVQCVVSDGVRFTFIHFQLNTLRHSEDDGIKNMVWLDKDNVLFRDMYPQDIPIQNMKKNRKTDKLYIRRMKTRRDPLLGCQDLNVDVYRKFLACYMNGAMTS